ncbi:hypothetical protein AB0I28_38880 [Phytomonospora sp. NPDC050363]|uniref:hypothetical protein n=1 Tax=Phytomonospora sp. NPDC050363 TaxID=3155642 RepID=UPI00340D614D
MPEGPRTRLELISEYADLRAADTGEARRTERLAGLVIALLGLENVTARQVGQAAQPTVTFKLGDRHHLLELRWPAAKLDSGRPSDRPGDADVRRVLLSIPGFTLAALDAARGEALLLDEVHLEAVLCGVMSAAVLLERAVEGLVIDGRSHSSLAELLGTSPSSPPPRLTWAHLHQDPIPSPDVKAPETALRAVLRGDRAWAEPKGMGLGSDGRLLVNDGKGVFEVDRRRPRTTWTTGVPDCSGAPLVDGPAVLLKHNEGIIRVHAGKVTPVGHVGPGETTLLKGRNGETWAFTTLEQVDGRPSHRFDLIGSTMFDGPASFTIDFDARLRSCVWLGERRFFLVADGHCAVVDLAVTTRVPEESWKPTPGHNPVHAVALSSGDLLLVLTDLNERRARVVRCDPELRGAEEIVEFAAFAVHGVVAGPEVITILADLRQAPDSPIRPVLFELRLPAPAGFRQMDVSRGEVISLSSMGRKGDYRIDAKTIGRGTGVAFKAMTSDLPQAKQRARREIEAARLFGDHPNVMPVLDSSRTYSWFVMPLAECTAEAVHAEFSEPRPFAGTRHRPLRRLAYPPPGRLGAPRFETARSSAGR